MQLSTDRSTKVYVILNPMAGSSDPARVREALKQYFTGTQWTYTVYETTGQEDIAELVRKMIDQGYELFIAIGGDGTVSGVVDGLVNTGLPLGIIPLGTGNALVRELEIPQDLDDAFQLLVGVHRTIMIDTIQVEQQFFVLGVSVGFSSLLMRATKRWSKRVFGLLAYIWTGLVEFMGFQPEYFNLMVDGQPHRVRAAEVTIANARILGASPFHWGPHIQTDDGHLDLCIIRARTFLDYLRLAWNLFLGREARDPSMSYLTVRQEAVIQADRSLPVQGDGEVIGQTPVQVHVAPRALRVIVPAE